MIVAKQRMETLGAALIVVGLVIAGAGLLYGVPLASKGLDSAQAAYESQGVELSYNEAGQLTDRGTPEGAEAILELLVDEWKFPLNEKNLDPQDPLINTRDEVMYQYATITYHVLHGERTVTLTQEDLDAAGGAIEYRGVTYDTPGDYDIEVGKYYAELDRNHPIERQLREAWSATALALTAHLAAGHANAATGELAYMTSFGMGAIGLLFAFAGGGLYWVARAIPLDLLPGTRRHE